MARRPAGGGGGDGTSEAQRIESIGCLGESLSGNELGAVRAERPVVVGHLGGRAGDVKRGSKAFILPTEEGPHRLIALRGPIHIEGFTEPARP